MERSIEEIKDTVKSFEGFMKTFQPAQPTPPMFYWPNNLQSPPNVLSQFGPSVPTVSPLSTPEAPVLQPCPAAVAQSVQATSAASPPGQIEQPPFRTIKKPCLRL